MDGDLFGTTTDVNGKPVVVWQERLEQMYTSQVPFVDFEVQQRVTPLAAALLEAGMDVDILLERMMGLG